MNLSKFVVPFTSDERMLYATEYLEKMGYENVDTVKNADFVVLPIPAKKYMFDGLDDKIVFYGMGDYNGYDYNKDESFLLKNAFLTAEGAIALFKENSDIALFNSKVLIVGYGRIAKALHRALIAFGCNVTVCSRSNQSKVIAKANGADCIDFVDLLQKNDYDVIFNTVPNIVFTKNEIDNIKKDAVLIELASFPGGVDKLWAKSAKLNLIDGSKLPSRYSKKSAGYLIGEAVSDIIKGGLT